MFLLIYKSLEIAIFQANCYLSAKETSTPQISVILFEVRETSLPFFIFVTFHEKTYTNGFPFTSL